MTKPVGVLDVAAYILNKTGAVETMKLQKLCFYAQAWSLVRDDGPLFGEPIEAWTKGPVIRELYNQHKGEFKVSRIPQGDLSKISSQQQQTIDAVIGFYGGIQSEVLSLITHQEDPWREARHGLHPKEPSNVPIALESMEEYYGELLEPDEGLEVRSEFLQVLKHKVKEDPLTSEQFWANMRSRGGSATPI